MKGSVKEEFFMSIEMQNAKIAAVHRGASISL
jgi:hypothetical protein